MSSMAQHVSHECSPRCSLWYLWLKGSKKQTWERLLTAGKDIILNLVNRWINLVHVVIYDAMEVQLKPHCTIETVDSNIAIAAPYLHTHDFLWEMGRVASESSLLYIFKSHSSIPASMHLIMLSFANRSSCCNKLGNFQGAHPTVFVFSTAKG